MGRGYNNSPTPGYSTRIYLLNHGIQADPLIPWLWHGTFMDQSDAGLSKWDGANKSQPPRYSTHLHLLNHTSKPIPWFLGYGMGLSWTNQMPDCLSCVLKYHLDNDMPRPCWTFCITQRNHIMYLRRFHIISLFHNDWNRGIRIPIRNQYITGQVVHLWFFEMLDNVFAFDINYCDI